jgi:enoyl-CoA hydratase
MPVGLEIRASAAIVTIDRPEAMNALDVAALRELVAVLERLAADREIRAVILTGAGERSFIGGADIRYMSRASAEQAAEFAALGHEAGRLLETMPQATIAAINGFALGGGCEIALACDLRYASPTAKFGQPEVNYGLVPGWGGTQRLARVAGIGFAKELILTGRFVDAQEALRRGLVDDIADPVIDRALETASLIAAKSPSAIAAAKELCNLALGGSHPGNLRAERDRLGELLTSADAREGLAAFLEKRTPSFSRPA